MEHKLNMANFCLVIILAIYASGLVASERQREDGLGALSKADLEPCKPSSPTCPLLGRRATKKDKGSKKRYRLKSRNIQLDRWRQRGLVMFSIPLLYTIIFYLTLIFRITKKCKPSGKGKKSLCDFDWDCCSKHCGGFPGFDGLRCYDPKKLELQW